MCNHLATDPCSGSPVSPSNDPQYASYLDKVTLPPSLPSPLRTALSIPTGAPRSVTITTWTRSHPSAIGSRQTDPARVLVTLCSASECLPPVAELVIQPNFHGYERVTSELFTRSIDLSAAVGPSFAVDRMYLRNVGIGADWPAERITVSYSTSTISFPIQGWLTVNETAVSLLPSSPPLPLFSSSHSELEVDECGGWCYGGYVCVEERCVSHCGDGWVTGDEMCDDGNQRQGDGCDEKCAGRAGKAAVK